MTELRTDRYVVTSAVKTVGKTYEILIEKIYPGAAVVVIDDKYRARLTPYDYYGPPKLIKKNSRFRASAKLYRIDGTLHIRIKEVVEVLD